MKKIYTLLFFALMSAVPCLVQAQYVIYPIPHTQKAMDGKVSFSERVNVVYESKIDEYTKNRAKEILEEHGHSVTFSMSPSNAASNLYLGTVGSGGITDELATTRSLDKSVLTKEGKFDRHILSLFSDKDMAQVLVLGENTDATFIGLATLEQMMDQTEEEFACVNFFDYADLQSRGLVEGYYGYPYSVEVKKDLLRFMMRYKMNTYLYGAKSDPYHSEKWKDAYPTSLTDEQVKNGWMSQQMLKEVAELSLQTKVNFIWAIHPGNSFINSSTVVSDIMTKFNRMYNLGVRQFGIFVDDVGLPASDKYTLNATRLTEVQRALETKYNIEGAAPSDTVKPIHFVPQAYAAGFVNNTEREGFFNALAATPKNVVIYTTGWGVWSIPNSSDLNAISRHLGRNVAWWWNYPCNDNADGQLFVRDMYGNFYDMPAVDGNGQVPSTLDYGVGIVSNPMQEGELSKIPLFSVADYSWNTSKFLNKTSWQAAVKAVVGEAAAEDYMFLADYLSYNDPAAFNTIINSAKSKLTNASSTQYQSLVNRLEKIEKACNTFIAFKDSEKATDRLFYKDIEPWLLKLHDMAANALTMCRLASNIKEGDPVEIWEDFLQANNNINDLNTAEKYIAYALEGMGSGISVSSHNTRVSYLYFTPFMSWLQENALNTFLSRTLPTKVQLISNLASTSGISARQNSTSKDYYLNCTRDITLGKNEYFGLSLPEAVKVSAITVDDDILSRFCVQYSADAREWTTFSKDAAIELPYVKYLIVVNQQDEAQTIRTNSKNLILSPLKAPTISSVSVPSGENAENQPLSNLTDGNYNTWWAVKANQKNGDTYTLNLSEPVSIYDVRICVGTKNDDYMNSARVEVSEDGNSWTALKIWGTSDANFTLSHSSVVDNGNEMKYCDFDGDGKTAKYVRLRVVSAKTNKWLRLFEMEVNKHSLSSSLCYDDKGRNLPAVYDGKAGTKCTPTNAKSVTYVLSQPNEVKSLYIYHDATKVNTLNLYVQENSSWQKVDQTSTSLHILDMTPYPSAQAVRIGWTGSVAPDIYEIEQDLGDEIAVYTGIRSVDAESGTAWRYENGQLITECSEQINRIEVYSLKGARLGTHHATAGKVFCLPLENAAPSVVIVRMIYQNGTSVSKRLLLKR